MSSQNIFCQTLQIKIMSMNDFYSKICQIWFTLSVKHDKNLTLLCWFHRCSSFEYHKIGLAVYIQVQMLR